MRQTLPGSCACAAGTGNAPSVISLRSVRRRMRSVSHDEQRDRELREQL